MVPANVKTNANANAKRGYFRRKGREGREGQGQELVGGWSGGGQGVVGGGGGGGGGGGLEAGQVSVKVGLREVCMRVETEMGLYETRVGMAVVVDVEMGV